MTAAMVLLVACGPGQICESDADRIAREQDQMRMLEQLRRNEQALASATAAATATAAASATAATSAAPNTTAAAAGSYSGTIKLGFDHPPFGPGNANLGGASAGIVCGKVTGAPPGGIIIDVTGGTGAPPSVNGPIGPDGAFILPFPINSYGPMEAKVSGVRTGAGTTLTGSIAPAKLEVGGGDDVACTP